MELIGYGAIKIEWVTPATGVIYRYLFRLNCRYLNEMVQVVIRALKRLVQLVLIVALEVSLSYAVEKEKDKPNPLLNEYLNPKLEEILKHSLKVIADNEDEGMIYLSMPGHSFVNGTQIVFFRKRNSRLEVISVGKVEGEGIDPKSRKRGIKINVDRDTIIKYPVIGDNAAPMSDPNALGNTDKRDEFDFLMPIDEVNKPPNDRPGYIEYGMGIMSGTMTSTTSTVANDSKKPLPYRFQISHFAYYSDYVPLGIEYDSQGGNFPTSTYYGNIVSSSESLSTLTLNYRFIPLLDQKLEIIGRIAMLNDKFKTSNSDEHLLNTTTSATGLGVRANYNLVPAIWKSGKRDPFFMVQRFYGELNYYPSVNATDGTVTRGANSSGSTGMQYRVGATMLFWFDFIPFLKRWVLEGSYGVKAYDLKFSGATVPESIANPIPIPQNTHSTEKETDFRFFFGIRFEDPIKMLFGKEKDKDKKK